MRRNGEWELNFDSAPFCNGSLHLGHVRNYVLGDVRARWLRKQGVDVSYVSAFDAFGLPNEVGAEEVGITTDEYISHQAARIDRQRRRLRLSYSNPLLPRYCDPAYYRWTQWLFLRLWDAGLIYEREGLNSYCPACEAFLANTQIQKGRCWRCSGKVVNRFSVQWYIRTTAYADRLFDGIDDLRGWSPRARRLLRSFMGRLEGVVTDLEIVAGGRRFHLRMFSEQDTPEDTASLAIRSDAPLARCISEAIPLSSRAGKFSSRSRRASGSSSQTTIHYIVLNARPVFLILYPPGDLPYRVDALLISGKDVPEPLGMIELPCHAGGSRPGVTYRIQDWLVSRNRSWGTPMPVVDCPNCGPEGASLDDLPLRLAAHGGDGSARCRRCRSVGRLIPRVLDCFFDDAWCFYGASRKEHCSENPFEAWRRNPPDRVHFHAGYDTFVYLHVFRFIGYFLHDSGITARPEPIDYYQGHDVVTAHGRKMSKRYGNAPDLDELLDRFDTDVVRLSVLSNANPCKPMSWTEDRLRHGMRIVMAIRRLMQVREQVQESRIDSQFLQADSVRVQRIRKRLRRVDIFIDEYRVGAAIDQLYVATGDIIRLQARNHLAGVSELITDTMAYWTIFAPETVERRHSLLSSGPVPTVSVVGTDRSEPVSA